jgi:hypothetical protein
MTAPKPLRTISINFPFQSSSVVNEPNLSTRRALFDFDVVVVRPYPLVGAHGDRRPHRVEWREYTRLNNEIAGRTDDISRLLHEGGLLVVVLDALEIVQCHTGGYTGGTLYTATNYDFLDDHFFESVVNGSGDRVSCNPADPFSKVIKSSDIFWTAFIGQRIPYPFSEATVFATNGKSSIVGASVEVGPGHIVFLPNFRRLDETLFFQACSDYRIRREGTPAPDWVLSIFFARADNHRKRCRYVGK